MAGFDTMPPEICYQVAQQQTLTKGSDRQYGDTQSLLLLSHAATDFIGNSALCHCIGSKELLSNVFLQLIRSPEAPKPTDSVLVPFNWVSDCGRSASINNLAGNDCVFIESIYRAHAMIAICNYNFAIGLVSYKK